MLTGLPDELIEQVADQLREVRVPVGRWILREGEDAESLFIVRSGRVEVIDEGPPETLLRLLRRGDLLGELGPLRTASARARGDVELLELGRPEFESLIQQAPSFALGLMRAMGAQLAAGRTPIVAASPPRAIALVGLDPMAPTAEVASALARALSDHGTVATLWEGELSTIDGAERDNDRVVLATCGTPGDDWTDLCVREADLVLALTSGVPDSSWLKAADALRGCELLVTGPRVSAAVLNELEPREAQVLGESVPFADALERTARRLAGKAVGVVLSGGGARAFAHLGALEELASAGVTFDRLAGVSLGSLVAAAVAAGFSFDWVRSELEAGFVERNPSNDFVPPAYSLIRGAKTRRGLRNSFGERRIEELPLRFFCVSCDLVSREPVVHRTGRVVDAVYPSLAIPGVFPPVARDGQVLVDGSVLDNLPVATMVRSGEGPVIAIDVSGRTGQFRAAHRPLRARLERPLRRLLTGSEAEIPTLGETIVRTMTIGASNTVSAARLHAELVIAPRVDDVGLMEWKALPRVYELGRQAARDALASDPELPSRLGL